jgi:hypothetical protein
LGYQFEQSFTTKDDIGISSGKDLDIPSFLHFYRVWEFFYFYFVTIIADEHYFKLLIQTEEQGQVTLKNKNNINILADIRRYFNFDNQHVKLT